MFVRETFRYGMAGIAIAVQIINVVLTPELSAANVNDHKLAGWNFDNDTTQKLKGSGILKLNLTAKYKEKPSNIFIKGVKGNALCLQTSHSCQFQSTKSLELQPPYTICFWLKPAKQQFSDIIGNKANSTKEGFRIRLESGKLKFSWGDGEKTYSVITTKVCIPLNKWTFVAITDDDDNISIIVNDKLEQKFEKEGDIKNSKRRLAIMNYSASPVYPFIGALDEVCLFNKVLTPAELKTLQTQ